MEIRNIIIFLLSIIIHSACTPKIHDSTKKNPQANQTNFSLLFGQQSVNFVDAPIVIESLSLVDETDERTPLLNDRRVNLANLSTTPQLIQQMPALAAGHYKKLHIRLRFDESSQIHFFHDSTDELIKSPYVNNQGQVLGVEADTFDMLIALRHKNGKTLDPHRPYALQIDWHLNRLFSIHKGENSTLVEVKPGIDAFFIEAPSITVQYKGEVKTVTTNGFTLQSDWSTSPITLINKASDNVIKIKDIVAGNATLQLSNNQLNTLSVSTFKPQDKVYKGVVITKEQRDTQIMLGKYNHKDFLQMPKAMMRIENQHLNTPLERSQILFTKNLPGILKGETEKSDQLRRNKHTLIVEYAENATLNTQEATATSTNKATILYIDGMSVANVIAIKLLDLKQPLTQGMHHIDAYLNSDCQKELSEENCTSAVVINQKPINSLSDYKMYTWNFNYYQDMLENARDDESLTPLEQKQAFKENADTEMLSLYDGKGIVLMSGLFNLFDHINNQYIGCCRAIHWERAETTNPPSQQAFPFIEVEITGQSYNAESDTPQPEIHYFYEYSDFAAWVEAYSIPLYLEEAAIYGKTINNNACSLSTERIYLHLITDPSGREYFRETFLGGDFSMANRGMSTAAFSAAWTAIGVAGIATMAGAMVLIKKLRNKMKAGSTPDADGITTPKNVESSISKALKPKITPTNIDLNKVPIPPTTKTKFLKRK